MTKFLMCVMLLWCAACGGSGSGVDGGKRLSSLSDAEIRDICEYAIDVQGPERMIDCGGGVTLTVGGGSVDECIAGATESKTEYPNCAATVDDYEACTEAFADVTDAQWCSDDITFPAACAPLFTAECGAQ